MRKREVEIGGRYRCQVSGEVVVVRILREYEYGGWVAVNETTGRKITVRSAQRLRARVYADPEFSPLRDDDGTGVA